MPGRANAGFVPAGFTVWRTLDASRRQMATRLHAVGKLEKREADAAARKEGGSEEE